MLKVSSAMVLTYLSSYVGNIKSRVDEKFWVSSQHNTGFSSVLGKLSFSLALYESFIS